MATKSANLYARIEPEVKEEAESILHRGLPFEVKIPSPRPIDMSTLSKEQLNAELEKGYADIEAGRTKPLEKVFADIREDYHSLY